ncbi:MAG: hypothetical protein BroJett029_26930 [Alphaproteobacteria bacterium]|nr:MAG: hypothetical protein BroJett029_26930 [Alphaproteobacteria bacterium]
MTAINAICLESEAFIATDSLFYSYAGEPLGMGAKVWTLPHLGSAIAFRGDRALSIRLYAAIMLRGDIVGGFDELVAVLPEIVESVLDGAKAELAANGLSEKAGIFLAYDLFVSGWSASAARMVLLCGTRRNGQSGKLQRFDFLSAPAIPGTDYEEAWGKDCDTKPVDLGQIVRYLERQRQYAHKVLSASQAGVISGDVVLVHVTRDAIQCGRIAQFTDYELRVAQLRKIAATGAVPTARGLTNDNAPSVSAFVAAKPANAG